MILRKSPFSFQLETAGADEPADQFFFNYFSSSANPGLEVGGVSGIAVEAVSAPNPKVSAVGGTTPQQSFTSFFTSADLPTDPYFNLEWNLLNTGQLGGIAGVDIDIVPVWKMGYTGKGISIGVFDTSMDIAHVDLKANIDMSKKIIAPDGSYVDPTKLAASGDEHATSVGGIIAAARNGVGVVGIAYDAKLTPVNIFDGVGANANYGWEALWSQNKFDVTNNSWGFTGAFVVSQLDSGAQYWVLKGFKIGADTGRGGLGTIENVAAGNYRQYGLTTETNGLTEDRHAVVVGGVDDRGMVTYYSNPGASLLVVAPTSGNVTGITTDDITGAKGYSSGDYTSGFGGTSAATPELSGIEAAMLQANSHLGWRDVQDILAISSRHVGSAVNDTTHGYESDPWTFNHAANWNGGAMHFSNDYGFGLVDARAAVELAKTWNIAFPVAHTSANEISVSSSLSGSWDIGHAKTNTLSFNITSHVSIEEMVLDLSNLKINAANHLTIDLISPTGTDSQLLIKNGGNGASIASGWELMSREFRNEDAYGTWTVKIVDSTASDVGSLSSAKLTAYGAPVSDNAVFFYTDEFAQYYTTARGTLSYSASSVTIDAAPVTGVMALNLLTGIGTIDGKNLTIASGTKVLTVIGGAGNDSLVANDFGNKLIAGLGNDVLTGGKGSDYLDSGAGNNTLTGGLSADAFVFHSTAFNTVTDFVAGTDKINIFGVEFGGNLAGGVNANDFKAGDASTHVAGGGFVFDQTTSILWWDRDGVSALTQLAQFSNHAILHANDFILV